MSPFVSRKLEYDDRVALQQADQAIKRDAVRALIELITNSNDSYHRLEDAGLSTDGTIVVEVQRRHSNASFCVRDYAEGMAGEDMDRKAGKYGGATSGFREGRSVRGFWGRGLKDAIFGLGAGSVVSVRDGEFNRCSLAIKGTTPTYDRERALRATRVLRNQWNIKSGNGTVVEVIVSRRDIRVPQFDNLRYGLEHHYELRPIVSGTNRKVVLRELDGRGNSRQEIVLSHKAPVGTKVLEAKVDVPGFPARAEIVVFRSDLPLTTMTEDGDYADAGLLVMSKHVVLALTLFKFEREEYASRFYGSVSCDYFHQLLSNDDTILTATRDGINWRHPFAKALQLAAEKELQPLVDEERRRAEAEQRSAVSKKLREKLNTALKELNSIAKVELGKNNGGSEDGEGDGEKSPYLPPSGFGFVPEYVYVQTGKPAGLSLRVAIPDKAVPGNLVIIESDNPEVKILTPQVSIQTIEGFPGIGQARVEVEGGQVGTEAVISARLAMLQTEALVKVISKREPSVWKTPTPRGTGLFRDFKFDPAAEPKQRVWFDRASSNIIIATKAPSVSTYLGETGTGHETPQGQVLLAELIVEAVCREIARRGVENGSFLAPSGAQTDAMQREYIRLQNQYAHVIHGCFVESRYRRDGPSQMRRGRPSREETLARAAVAG